MFSYEYVKNVYEKVAYFCLLLIRDGFLIFIIPSRKSRPVPETQQSSLCGPPLGLCKALNNATKKSSRAVFGVLRRDREEGSVF